MLGYKLPKTSSVDLACFGVYISDMKHKIEKGGGQPPGEMSSEQLVEMLDKKWWSFVGCRAAPKEVVGRAKRIIETVDPLIETVDVKRRGRKRRKQNGR